MSDGSMDWNWVVVSFYLLVKCKYYIFHKKMVCIKLLMAASQWLPLTMMMTDSWTAGFQPLI